MPATKTDNSWLRDKAELRARHSPWPDHGALRVLDAFGGKGHVWAATERIAGKPVVRTAIDNRTDLSEFHLHGDNAKVLAGLDLDAFDVVDLDAYGVPIEQLIEVLDSGFRGVVFVTVIQTMMGRMPVRMASEIGIPEAVTKKAPSLIARRGWQYFREWLAVRGVRQITHRSRHRKHYLCFSGAEVRVADSGSPPAGTSAGPS